MILTTGRGVKFVAHFSYRGHQRWTVCGLHHGLCEGQPCTVSLGEGYALATCNPKDEFRKAVGRKIALAKSMAQLGLPRDLRTTLWADYRRQVRP
jgi:hypothetical protein